MVHYSFLICAYNVQTYIQACLDSLINQTGLQNKYEIVIVDDGSTDATKDILQQARLAHPQLIQIIEHQTNQGLPFARQTALTAAKGQWIIYVDGDDYVSPNLLATIAKHDTNQSINTLRFYEQKDQKAAREDQQLQKHKMNDSLATCAFRRTVFEGYEFPKYRYAIEDWDFFVFNFPKLKVLDLTHEKHVFYHYRYNPNSLSKSPKVYRSRLLHALAVLENPMGRANNFNYFIVGHYYEHLYMMARLWFPDLLDRVKASKYQTKVSLSLKIQYWIVKLGIFNVFIRKTKQAIDA